MLLGCPCAATTKAVGWRHLRCGLRPANAHAAHDTHSCRGWKGYTAGVVLCLLLVPRSTPTCRHPPLTEMTIGEEQIGGLVEEVSSAANLLVIQRTAAWHAAGGELRCRPMPRPLQVAQVAACAAKDAPTALMAACANAAMPAAAPLGLCTHLFGLCTQITPDMKLPRERKKKA